MQLAGAAPPLLLSYYVWEGVGGKLLLSRAHKAINLGDLELLSVMESVVERREESHASGNTRLPLAISCVNCT